MAKKKAKQAKKLKSESNGLVLCEGCGKRIPKERLKVIPDACLCVQCATKFEDEFGVDRIIPLSDYDASELLDVISPDG